MSLKRTHLFPIKARIHVGFLERLLSVSVAKATVFYACPRKLWVERGCLRNPRRSVIFKATASNSSLIAGFLGTSRLTPPCEGDCSGSRQRLSFVFSEFLKPQKSWRLPLQFSRAFLGFCWRSARSADFIIILSRRYKKRRKAFLPRVSGFPWSKRVVMY